MTKRLALLLIVTLPLCGCYGYRVRRTAGWNNRSQVAANTRELRSLNANSYWTRVLRSPDSPESVLYIPNYSYYQGLVYSPKGLSVIGQVRLIGGAAAREDISMRNGAMATTNPDAFRGRVKPTRYRYHVSEWHEVQR
jgi:hypothetical protein